MARSIPQPCVALAALGLLFAEAAAQGPSRGGPPPPAYDACAGSSAEDACSFRTPHGSESGVCVYFGDQLACLPEGAPRPPSGRPGEEAVSERMAEALNAPRHKLAELKPIQVPPAAPASPPVSASAAGLPIAEPPRSLAPASESAPAPPPAPTPARAPSFPLIGFLGGLGAAAVLLALWLAWAGSKPAAPTEAPAAAAATQPLPQSAQLTLRTFSPPSGALIGGVYKAVREIGSGGMGVVYEALDTKLDRRVAIKRLRQEIGQSPRARERFLTEARTVAKLQHPNIVNIHAIIEEGPDLFLVFEFVDGPTLDQMLARTERLAPAELVRVFVGVAEAVDYAHSQRVIHRDLKPSNIMVDASGRPKVMDFGIAHQARVTISQLTMAEAAGTYPYMPPEQALGHAVRESDVFAFAAVTYEALTGDLPFPGPDFNLQKAAMAFKKPSEAVPLMPRGVDAVFERAFQAEPKRRHPTAGEFVRSLRGAIASS